MRTSFRIAAALALVVAGQALAASTVQYTVEIGGDPKVASYEAGQYPVYVRGSNADGQTVAANATVNWAVTAVVSGTHSGGAFDTLAPAGIANAVFTLELKDSLGSTLALGHATPENGPTVAGWYSVINDGDNNGARGSLLGQTDPLANAAFPSVFNVGGVGNLGGRLFDNAASGGPFVDFYHYPSATGLPAAATNCGGKLIGMGAGYSSFQPTAIGGPNTAGVGLVGSAGACAGLGDKVEFEGQISTVGLAAPATYTLVLTAGSGTNILPATADMCTLGPTGAFAVAPNVVNGDSISFSIVTPCTGLALSSAVSQKTHGTAGNFSTASGAVEGRSAGPTRIVATFNQNVHRVNNTAADFTLSSGTLGTVTVAGGVVTAAVSGVTNMAIFTIGFPGIAADCDNSTVATTKCWKVLQGDANGASPVNNFDILAIRAQLGQTANATNYKTDVNASGKVDNFDMLFTRGKLTNSVAGTCLP